MMKNKMIKLFLLGSIFLYCSTMIVQASFVDFLIQQGDFSDEEIEEASELNDLLEQSKWMDRKNSLEIDADSFHQNQENLLKFCHQSDLKSFQALKNKVFRGCRNDQDFVNQWTLLCNPEEGPTPLLWATLSDNVKMVEHVVDYADRDNIFNQSVLYWAVRLEYAEIVGLLLRKGFDLHKPCRHYHDVFNNRDQRAKHIKKQIITLHKKREKYQESMTPMQEAMIKQNQTILSLFISFDKLPEAREELHDAFRMEQKKEKNIVMVDNGFDEEIDCAIPVCPVITLTVLPFMHFGCLYLSQLYSASSNITLPASTDSTYF